MDERLQILTAGMAIPYGGDRLTRITADLAARFQAGDRLIVVQETGALLHIPAAQHAAATAAVTRARKAFETLAQVTDDQISAFFDAFAARLDSVEAWAAISAANAQDVEAAKRRSRSVTRLQASEAMRRDMVAGLRGWRDSPPSRGRVVERVDHPGWSVELLTAPLGVVGFIFEGRPNVFADAAGVLRGGNTAVFRIGADALGTARAIVEWALDPAITAAGLPDGAACLLDEADRAAGWALFSDSRLALAVARGSGAAVAELGAVARQAGLPVSLHGTGGAWMVADVSADAARFSTTVEHSLDRKVCNTLNVCCIVEARAAELTPLFLEALDRAGASRGHGCKLHIAPGAEAYLPTEWLHARTNVRRADGDHDEPRSEPLAIEDLAREWEWEETPEVSLAIVPSLNHALDLFNRLSPRLDASLIAEDPAAQARFFAGVDAPFVGDGFTRWVDGQYALGRPELGLSNWEHGRLFARGGVLSGDGVYTVRTRARQTDPSLRR